MVYNLYKSPDEVSLEFSWLVRNVTSGRLVRFNIELQFISKIRFTNSLWIKERMKTRITKFWAVVENVEKFLQLLEKRFKAMEHIRTSETKSQKRFHSVCRLSRLSKTTNDPKVTKHVVKKHYILCMNCNHNIYSIRHISLFF